MCKIPAAHKVTHIAQSLGRPGETRAFTATASSLECDLAPVAVRSLGRCLAPRRHSPAASRDDLFQAGMTQAAHSRAGKPYSALAHDKALICIAMSSG
jgi:hypothetical protein